ncbi:hypothetical protein MT325_M024L [Paramecium bursaria chlorella virus MT325]|uniref:Uncharacterized protein M024L n=1 Tax=Paramecium bursaria Chlorella virus MT325 TaxID=346932 RepID=A7ITA4_PBCVM|nr:hypothetical protein MT325_M024L [Paramecium bursaria chlorella virus MT325]
MTRSIARVTCFIPTTTSVIWNVVNFHSDISSDILLSYFTSSCRSCRHQTRCYSFISSCRRLYFFFFF